MLKQCAICAHRTQKTEGWVPCTTRVGKDLWICVKCQDEGRK